MNLLPGEQERNLLQKHDQYYCLYSQLFSPVEQKKY